MASVPQRLAESNLFVHGPVDHAICLCVSARGAGVAGVTGAAEWRGDGL